MGIGFGGRTDLLFKRRDAFTRSSKNTLVLILPSFMLRLKNIFMIFTAINRNRIKTAIAFVLCLYIWSSDHTLESSLKHWLPATGCGRCGPYFPDHLQRADR